MFNFKDEIRYFNETTLVEIKQIIAAIWGELRAMGDEFEGIHIEMNIKPLKKEKPE